MLVIILFVKVSLKVIQVVPQPSLTSIMKNYQSRDNAGIDEEK